MIYSTIYFSVEKEKQMNTAWVELNLILPNFFTYYSLSLLCKNNNKKSLSLSSFCFLIVFFHAIKYFAFWISLNQGNKIYFNYSWAYLSANLLVCVKLWWEHGMKLIKLNIFGWIAHIRIISLDDKINLKNGLFQSLLYSNINATKSQMDDSFMKTQQMGTNGLHF